MPDSPQISVVIVNYNGAEFIQFCIDSVLSQCDVTVELIVIDNNSADNSLELLAAYADKIQLLANSDNKGFGAANNQAATLAGGDYLYLLNPDAYLTDDYALKRLLACAIDQPHIGLWGTKIVSDGIDADYIKEGYPRQKYSSDDFSTLPGELPWIIGASMFLKADFFAQLKGFDENFFLYGEETDFCIRCRKADKAISINEDVVIEHIGGGCEQPRFSYQKWLNKHTGLLKFAHKHYGDDGFKRLHAAELRTARWRSRFYRMTGRQEKAQRYAAVVEASGNFLAPK